MSTGDDDARRRRRALRLGALLFRLRYYMATPADVTAHLYRLDAATYVQVWEEQVLFVRGEMREWLDLEAAIARCRDALAADTPLHRGGESPRQG